MTKIYEYDNKLSKKEIEALAILAEECGELIQVIGKILRHGKNSYSPNDAAKIPNHHLLHKEFADVCAAWMLLDYAKVTETQIDMALAKKLRWCHYQNEEIF